MRAKIHQKKVLLVTDDPTVETTVRSVAEKTGYDLRHLKTNRDAMCVISDANASEDFVMIDLDGQFGRRSLLNTAGGLLPVIAIFTEEKPWLRSMLRQRCIAVSLAKPITQGVLTDAINRLREFPETAALISSQQCVPPASAESIFESDFDQSLRFALCQRPGRANCGGFCRGRCTPPPV